MGVPGATVPGFQKAILVYVNKGIKCKRLFIFFAGFIFFLKKKECISAFSLKPINVFFFLHIFSFETMNLEELADQVIAIDASQSRADILRDLEHTKCVETTINRIFDGQVSELFFCSLRLKRYSP